MKESSELHFVDLIFHYVLDAMSSFRQLSNGILIVFDSFVSFGHREILNPRNVMTFVRGKKNTPKTRNRDRFQ